MTSCIVLDDSPTVEGAMPRAELTPQIAVSADVDASAVLGQGTIVWPLAQIRKGARLGRGCIVGRDAYVGAGVLIGDHVKIQNHALVYEPAELADGVFIGPGVVLTNDRYPRSITRDGTLKTTRDWQPVGVRIERGASIGASAVCVAPVRIGRWAMVAAGAVVTSDVPDFGLAVGVPARRTGWVGPAGVRLSEARVSDHGRIWRCPATDEEFLETAAGLREANG